MKLTLINPWYVLKKEKFNKIKFVRLVLYNFYKYLFKKEIHKAERKYKKHLLYFIINMFCFVVFHKVGGIAQL